jgi:hypothetical protein
MVDEVVAPDFVECVGIPRALVFPHEFVETSDDGLVLVGHIPSLAPLPLAGEPLPP